MAAPSLALRFRDTTPGVDTIWEHKALIEHEGAVWWGWWRKETEPEHREFLASFTNCGGHALLIDRASRRCFIARFTRVVYGADTLDRARVPSYYRSSADKVAAWFLVADIQASEYRDQVALQLGETTLLPLQAGHTLKPVTTAPSRCQTTRNCVLHLSDLHFGADYGFQSPDTTKLGTAPQSLTSCLVADLRRAGAASDIGAVIVTGDVTTCGDWSDATRQHVLDELTSLLEALDVPHEHLVLVPGNHDVVRYPAGKVDPQRLAVERQTTSEHERPFRTFVHELCGRDWRLPLSHERLFEFADVDVDVAALDSCRIVASRWTEYGYVGDAGYDVLNRIGRMQPHRPTYRIMALHHHVIPVAEIEAPNQDGVSLTLDAVRLLDRAADARVQIVLHGHQHVPRVSVYEHLSGRGHARVAIASAGSTGAKASRRPEAERNGYSLLRLTTGGVRLQMRELRPDCREGATLFDAVLPCPAILRED